MKDKEVLYAECGFVGFLILCLTKIMIKKGFFCYTPCGAHVCIFDTNNGSERLDKAIESIAMDTGGKEKKKIDLEKSKKLEMILSNLERGVYQKPHALPGKTSIPDE